MRGRKPPRPPLNVVAFPSAPRPHPGPPDYLSAAAKKVWDETARILVASNIYDEDCRQMLAAYCVQYARFVEADAHVQREGLILKSKRGAGRYNPFVNLSNSALHRALKLARQLGLTPASRRHVARTRIYGSPAPAAKFLRHKPTRT
jgi:P27 family predicted phage terminase small subunit